MGPWSTGNSAAEGPELEVDCAACHAWQAPYRAGPRRAAPVMARLRAAFTPGHAA